MNSEMLLSSPAASPRLETGVCWHLLTPEFPPQRGGVGDYVFLLARALADLGDEVHIWCPGPGKPNLLVPGVLVHPQMRDFSPASLWRAGRAVNQFPKPRVMVLQWVPHGFGWLSMNVPFCLWMWGRGRLHGDDLAIMVHEPFLAFREGNWRQDIAAFVHRLMTVTLLNATQRVWVSTPRWEKRWRPYALGRVIPFSWLPLPSTVPVAGDNAAVAETRAQYAMGNQRIVGHFGTFGHPIIPMLKAIIPPLFEGSNRIVLLLIGPRGEEFRDMLLRENPQHQDRIHATGSISAGDPRLSAHLAACDVMIQPYPDGVSSRRTSILAPLAHGVPAVTTYGPSTESLWLETEGVAIVPAGDPQSFLAETLSLLQDESARRHRGRAAALLSQEHFTIEGIAETMRSTYLRSNHG